MVHNTAHRSSLPSHYCIYGFTHTTSSPHYPQSNGLAERTVKTVKGLLKEAADPHVALLTYRATHLPWCTLSPAELLMGRKLCTYIPTTTTSLTPQWKFLDTFREKDRERKRKQKEQFDQRHRTRRLPDIPDNSNVWINTGGISIPGQITSHSTAHAYIMLTHQAELYVETAVRSTQLQVALLLSNNHLYDTGNTRSNHDMVPHRNTDLPSPETHLRKVDVA